MYSDRPVIHMKAWNSLLSLTERDKVMFSKQSRGKPDEDTTLESFYQILRNQHPSGWCHGIDALPVLVALSRNQQLHF